MPLYIRLILVVLLIGLFCFYRSNKQSPLQLVNVKGASIATRFTLPAGYTRMQTDSGSFGAYLQNLPLKPHGTLVHLYDGKEKPNKVAAGILIFDVGKKDLQQCADAVMRIRAEYLYKQKQYDAIHFNFVSGFNASYSKWRSGYRISVNGNNVSWIKSTKESVSYQSFREYLDKVFTYAGTASLAKELKAVNLADMKIGDVLIKGGSPGHAVTIVDMAVNAKTGKKLFMIAQSYMPAQDIHVLINSDNAAISPWHELNVNAAKINTPEWVFTKDELKRF